MWEAHVQVTNSTDEIRKLQNTEECNPTGESVGLQFTDNPLKMEEYDSDDDVFNTQDSKNKHRTSREPSRAPAQREQARHVPTYPIRIPNKTIDSIPEQRENIHNGSLFGSVESVDSSENLHQERKTLTVNKKWKVDEQLNRRMLASNKPSMLIPVAKWIATIVLAAGLLACLGASKLYMLKLAVRLNIISSKTSTAESRTEATHLFLMIFLAIVIPYFLNFLRAIFVALCRSDMPWPNRKSVLLGILSATLESFGVCVFALKVLTYYGGVTAILLMNCVFIIPFFTSMLQSIRSRSTHHISRYSTLRFTGGFLLQCVGVVFALYVTFEKSQRQFENMWHVFAALVSLTIAWTPSLQQSSVVPVVDDDVETEMIRRPRHNPGSNISSGSSGFNTGNSTANTDSASCVDDDPNEGPPAHKLRNTTWKMAIISNFVKVVGVMVFSYIFFYIDSSVYAIDAIFNPETHTEFLDAWNIVWDNDTKYFLINLLTTMGGYALAFIACHIAIHKWAFAIPISLTGPGFVTVLTVKEWCNSILNLEDAGLACENDNGLLWAVIISTACLFLAHLLSATYPIFSFKMLVLQRESAVVWIPSFNGVFLEQWLILNRKTVVTDINNVQPRTEKQKTQVYICTTMYRETEDEMRQLLESINRINMARTDNDRFFESHVILDGGVRSKNVSEFALQLLTLLEETLNIKTENCTKVKTPYGMKLSWKLPRASDKINHMTFNIHLKDGLKVKNKKRWSQVMYMSYVIDFLMESEDDENCYILTTDADVKFTPESVEALLDLMTRDTRVGAVCARTHPMGSGPLVWYQVFEYAIGHWFQKAAEHVLGSVLCAPGCFSVYRCVALKEILTVYATNVEHAFDFLTKDMGEDRWLCTLMVQSGWRIEYCAASENATNCPSEFEEFYKQRRRWIASTVANLMLLMKQWQIIRHFNQRIALLFIVYQGALLFSTLIGPSTVILIISGGLTYAWDIDSVASVIIQILICVVFAAICLYTSDKTQMMAAKLLTFFYAIVMTAVVVGTAEQIVDDLGSNTPSASNDSTPSPLPPSDISIDLPISVTTIYFAAIAAIFGTAALMHPRESYCLVNGVWYLLCLPSGYLVLMIYSVCNITDRSWGTREEKTESAVKKEPWYSSIRNVLENIFFCCGPKAESSRQSTIPVETQTTNRWQSTDDLRISHSASLESLEDSMTEPTTPHQKAFPGIGPIRPSDPDDDIEQDVYNPISVENWLEAGLREKYSPLFKSNGYENTMFISGMTEKELKSVGVTVKAHLQFLLTEIESLPSFEIEYAVPSSVDEWLEIIGLSCYKRVFNRNHIKKPEDLSVLKSFKRKEIEKELKITKAGHIKRLLYAIRKLREPTEAERRAMEMKTRVERSPRHHLRQSNVGEYDFWKQLIGDSLKPGNKAFGIEGELKERLSDLRNSWLLILAVSNTIWLILITTLASKGDLTILGANPLGLSFLFIFGTLLVVQFLAMILHRISTLVHFLARAPFKYGAPMRAFWSFDDDFRFQRAETKDDWEAIQTIKHQENRLREKKRQQRVQISRSYGSHTETTSLLRPHNS